MTSLVIQGYDMDQERELAWEWAGQFLSNSAWTRKNYFFSKLKNEAGVGRSLLFCGDTLHRFKCNYRYETFKIWLDTGTEELVIFYHLLFYLFMHSCSDLKAMEKILLHLFIKSISEIPHEIKYLSISTKYFKTLYSVFQSKGIS